MWREGSWACGVGVEPTEVVDKDVEERQVQGGDARLLGLVAVVAVVEGVLADEVAEHGDGLFALLLAFVINDKSIQNNVQNSFSCFL